MNVLIIEGGQMPRVAEIASGYQAMQTVVGGPIQVLYPFEDPEVALVANDEGKLQGLPLNRGLWDDSGNLYDIIAGTFFLCGAPTEGEDLVSLSQAQMETYTKRFATPESFLYVHGRWVAMPQVAHYD